MEHALLTVFLTRFLLFYLPQKLNMMVVMHEVESVLLSRFSV